MSKLSCEVIKDLLPLYVDEIASTDSKKIVLEHMGECEKCRAEMEAMKAEYLTIPTKLGGEDDKKVISSFKRKWKLKLVLLLILVTIIAVMVCLFGVKMYMDAKRPDINGNEFILSTSLGANGEPTEVVFNMINGLHVEKTLGEVYISIPVNNKNMTECRVRLLREGQVLQDSYIPVSEERFVSVNLENIEDYTSGIYMLEYYNSDGDICQYKWFLIWE